MPSDLDRTRATAWRAPPARAQLGGTQQAPSRKCRPTRRSATNPAFQPRHAVTAAADGMRLRCGRSRVRRDDAERPPTPRQSFTCRGDQARRWWSRQGGDGADVRAGRGGVGIGQHLARQHLARGPVSDRERARLSASSNARAAC